MNKEIEAKTALWLSGHFDETTKQEIRHLQTNDPANLEDAFYRNLEFGTGGLRGLMGAGTNRMNKYTVGMATQGFADYLKETFKQNIKVVISHDCRNNSRFFAETVAQVMAANGIEVFLFPEMSPTPMLSFAIRHLHAQGGVMCTASHNPKEYNGYKAYFNDGAQLTPPHDVNVIKKVETIASIDEVKWTGGEKNIKLIDTEMDDMYINMVNQKMINPKIIKQQSDIKIVYTSIHGTGITVMPKLLDKMGFKNIHIVEKQRIPDGNFPTVVYPNPEEPEAMKLGLEKAKKIDADILMGTDPDADRIALGVKNENGEWQLLNGNQMICLTTDYVLEQLIKTNKLPKNPMVVKTIVSTPMMNVICKHYGINCYDVLTGFKWIAQVIREQEGKEKYVIGGEESFGLMWGDECRDKDSLSAAALVCEIVAMEKAKGRTLFQRLVSLYEKYGLYQEELFSITIKGMQGQQEIATMMDRFRQNPPKTLNQMPVVELKDYELQKSTHLVTNKVEKIALPKSNVLQFVLDNGSWISARPSGTEPKIKFYFSVKSDFKKGVAYQAQSQQLKQDIQVMIQDMGLKK
ncbi:MAG: phospho-sugar mutase [Chitinophagaceae bacterium]